MGKGKGILASTTNQPVSSGPCRWILRGTNKKKLAELLADPAAKDLPEVIFYLLAGRLIEGDTDLGRHLEPLLKNLSDPLELPDMASAVERLITAIEGGEKITLFGDYDVDGVTAVSLMLEVLAAYGVEAGSTLPRRKSEGYGLSESGVARCLEENAGTSLLIAIDCGTNNREQAALLAAAGIDLIVLDHHETSVDKMVDCVAVVNPKRPDGGRHAYLCSVGIVFKVAHALLRERPVASGVYDLRDGLDLVALGTVADVVPLVGENRILVKRGLDRMMKRARPGLLALRQVAGVRQEAVGKASSIGFLLGPRINAAGRLGNATDALDLLRAEDATLAGELAGTLDRLNRERRQIEDDILTEAEEMAEEHLSRRDDPALVLGGDGWHAGVVGIVAARIVRKFHRPALVIGFDEAGLGKGSGRSVTGFDLVAAVDASRHYLAAGGGHAQAVGLTVQREHFEAFREAFLEAVVAAITSDQLERKIYLDAELELEKIDFPFLAALECLAPFGSSNPEPLFLATGVRPAAEPRWLKEKHLKVKLLQNGARHEAIYFNCPPDLPPPPWDIAFSPGENHYQGRTSIQLMLRGIRAASGVERERDSKEF